MDKVAEFLWRTLAAGLSMFVRPILEFAGTLASLGLATFFALASIFAITGIMGKEFYQDSKGVARTIISSLITFTLLTGLAAIALPLLALAGIWSSITSMYKGAIAGWNEGLGEGITPPVQVFVELERVFTGPEQNLSFIQGIVNLAKIVVDGYRERNNQQAPEFPAEPSGEPDNLLGSLRRSALQTTASSSQARIIFVFIRVPAQTALNPFMLNNERPARSLTAQEFTNLQLSSSELATLVRERAALQPLTAMQIATLRNDEEARAKLETYENMRKRYEEEPCIISLERPEPANTVLLVKQYQNGRTWLPCPLSTHIFDRENVKRLYEHPFNATINAEGFTVRDEIPQPPRYGNHPTRYICHDYYVNGEGLSQELNMLRKELEEKYLELQPAANEPPAPGGQHDRFFNSGAQTQQNATSSANQQRPGHI